jgi:signal transduction histidine kinase
VRRSPRWLAEPSRGRVWLLLWPAASVVGLLAACAYFVCSEALANVAKYAAASKVAVSVRSGPGGTRVEVEDDGAGGADPGRGTGLRGLADRVETLGGTLTVDSPPGRGTRLVAVIAPSSRRLTVRGCTRLGSGARGPPGSCSSGAGSAG